MRPFFLPGKSRQPADPGARRYSALMADSQALVAEDTLAQADLVWLCAPGSPLGQDMACPDD